MKRLITHHMIKPDALEAYLEATLAMVAEARRSPSVHTMELFRHTDSPDQFHLLEIYLRDSACEDHSQSPPYLAWRDALEKQDLLAAEETRVPVEPVRPEDSQSPECSSDSIVTLQEIDNKNVGPVLALQVTEYQDEFVARNTRSLAQAYAAGARAWVRAVYADEVPVGFVMLSVDPETPRYYLWRYMIDRRYQGMGFGRLALELVVDHVRTLPDATELFLSYVPGEGSPKPFYEKGGFRDTGVRHGSEFEMRLAL
ncbi:MAG TPA: GNAT family N-acetyltransferase [Anaerolineales bacterium]|nr:GNAT family N-acetyltransferase [Anaerolineales bacterium]